MKKFFTTLPQNLYRSFAGKNIFLHLAAIIATYGIVTTGFDWRYYLGTRSEWLRLASFPAVGLGAILPIILPIGILLFGVVRKDARLRSAAWAMGQAALLGSVISSVYKAFTGRMPPSLTTNLLDISHGFNFGFLQNGVFWGWPSSHTTIAFAVSVAFVCLYPEKRKLVWLALLYAFYVGLGVSTTIHWFSEFVAGALIGTAIGLAVGRSFRQTKN